MAINFRAFYRWALPGNYSEPGTDGEKVLHSLMLILDAYDQIQKDRLTARFPSYAGDSALALIGADRGIIRGRAETTAHYAARLIPWRYPRGHRVRGNAFALLEQISEYFGGGFEIYTIQDNGLDFIRAADGTESVGSAGDWDWDSTTVTTGPYRFWVVIDGTNLISPTPAYGDPTLYGGQHGDSANAVGHTGISADDVNAIRRMLRGRAWKPAGTRAMWAILSFDGTEVAPEGLYGKWSTNAAGNYVAARSSAYRYWALDPTALIYAGDPTAFPSSSNMPGGGTYAGDPTSFPTSSPLVSAPVYAGNPANFPRSAKLIDDGSIP
jgi:hypothetical protein